MAMWRRSGWRNFGPLRGIAATGCPRSGPFEPGIPFPTVTQHARRVRLNVILIPLLIITGGVVTAMMVPLDWRLRAMIIATDVFAAITVGLVLLRMGNRR